jgi:hypothetical protein
MIYGLDRMGFLDIDPYLMLEDVDMSFTKINLSL